jgi:hypothetical protein
MSQTGLGVGMMPSPEEIAEIEARKAQIREEVRTRHRDEENRYHGGSPWTLTEADREHERKRLIMLEESKREHARPEPAPAGPPRPETLSEFGDCPQCGTPYRGRFRRCWTCHPSSTRDLRGTRLPKPPETQTAPPEVTPVSSGDCPTCGRPFGKRRRCFVCKPATPKLGQVSPEAPTVRATDVRIAEPEPEAVADVLSELDAIRTVYETLRALPEPSLVRVRRYLDEVLWKGVSA